MYFSEKDSQAQLDRLLLQEIQEYEQLYVQCSVSPGGKPCTTAAKWYIRCLYCHTFSKPMCDLCRRVHIEALRLIQPFTMECCKLVATIEQLSFKKIPLPE